LKTNPGYDRGFLMAEISRVVLFPFSKALVEEFNDML